MKKIYIKQYVIILLLLSVSITEPLYPWSYHTHRKITSDAIRLMPDAFKGEFSAYKEHFLRGATDPDTLLKDFRNHVYHPYDSYQSGLSRIQELFNKLVEMVENKCEPEKIAYIFGLISHYIADINQPLHTDGVRRDPDESTYHAKFERDLNRYLSNLVLPKIKYKPVTRIRDRTHSMAIDANRHYDEIGSAYKNGLGISDVKNMAFRQIDKSIQNIVDFWLGIYSVAGKVFPESESTISTIQYSAKGEKTGGDELKANNMGEKININSASKDELSIFFKISPLKSQRIIDARPFRSEYELAKIEGFNVFFVKRNKERIQIR